MLLFYEPGELTQRPVKSLFKVPRTLLSLNAFIGITLGFVFASIMRLIVLDTEIYCKTLESEITRDFQEEHFLEARDGFHNSSQNLLFVGVMTANKYLQTRVKAVHETWGPAIPGAYVFFSSNNLEPSMTDNIPLVRLTGVDDSYPPQKKSFLMLKYMYEHFGDKFEWFMRADDDVYIRPDKLEAFLRSVDSSKPQFIGQAGRGSQEEFGSLSLEYDENFCMGGPGVIMSYRTLALVAPHVSYCLRNLYSTHEDVELGRCVRRFANIPCTWSYEMQTIFYHNSSGSDSFSQRLKYKEVHRAITLHPVKQFQHLYRIQNYMEILRIKDLLEIRHLLRRTIGTVSKLFDTSKIRSFDEYFLLRDDLMKSKVKEEEDIIPWELFTYSVIHSTKNSNPRRKMELYMRETLDDAIREIMEVINIYSKQRGRILDFKEILYCYHRFHPLNGQDIILDVQMVYKKYRGRKMTVPVRRHTYLHRTFINFDIHETITENKQSNSLKENNGINILESDVKLSYRSTEVINSNLEKQKTITFVIPLAGRVAAFKRFASLYEEICLAGNQATSLVIILFPNQRSKQDIGETVAVVRKMKEKYPQASISVIPVDAPFARALALQRGIAHVQARTNDTILFLIDVDVIFTSSTLQRVRLNTIKGKQVYFPIVFSQFDAELVYNQNLSPNHLLISDKTGYWRNYGFGLASVYPSDVNLVGGFNTNIIGWGKEDVDVYDKFIKSNFTIFRAADPGIVHVFHRVECDLNLNTSQLIMCFGTRYNTYGGKSQLLKILDLYNR